MKKKIFGIPMLALVLGLLVVGGATAAVVNYLSNSVEVKANVESPLTLEVREQGTGTFGDELTVNKYGGETLEVDYRIKNQADIRFEKVPFTVTFSKPETHLTLDMIEDYGYVKDDVKYSVLSNCVLDETGWNTIKCTDYLNIEPKDTEQEVAYVTFAGNTLPGEYTITTQLMYDTNTVVVPVLENP